MSRHHADAFEALPDTIELVVVGVHAGLSPTVAVERAGAAAAAPLRPVFDAVEHRLRRGQCLADALGALTDELGPHAAVFIDTLATADRYGRPVAPALDRLAADIRAERRHQAERWARTLPVRLAFPLVTCTLPSFVLLAIVPALLGAVSMLRDSAP